MLDDTTRLAVGLLLDLTDDDTAARVRARIGLHSGEPSRLARRRIRRAWNWSPVPSSVALWTLEQDDPQLNALVWPHLGRNTGLRRAVVRGLPFGPGRTAPVPVDPKLAGEEPEIPGSYVRHGLVGALRAVDSMSRARAASSMVLTREDWSTVAEADAEQPLPGYTRWVLSIRPDCPPALRARFGTHAKFTHRLRQAGVLDGPAAYATGHGPAVRVLEVLAMGRLMFPARVPDAERALRPLVHRHLGNREEAWAVLAQIAETFHGTAPELLMTAGALA
ncbi:hypothetical protein [Streptomyces griseoruber]|uniref:Uncharacterized protein n=1 Tax=Streptomyces griseoruber TaxID=1943 RepID=A0A101SUH2_9ACTN|nr:hypothetical protein [Streptomyces griseoruber]KUN80439.1 hypothetical protein AQJ64_25480 [Streptomyces griseoruber]